MGELTLQELRLLRYSLGFLRSSLDASLRIEAAQEIAPETQASGAPLPDAGEAIQALERRLSEAIRVAKGVGSRS